MAAGLSVNSILIYRMLIASGAMALLMLYEAYSIPYLVEGAGVVYAPRALLLRLGDPALSGVCYDEYGRWLRRFTSSIQSL